MSLLSSLRVVMLVSVAAVVLAGCTGGSPAANSGAPAAQEKSGETTKTGKVIKLGQKFYLEERGKEPLELDSYTVDLEGYVGQTLTVVGQYSGNTLFVSSVTQ